MKILQEPQEKSYELAGLWALKTIEYKPDGPKSITLLLHGYNERGLRTFRKLRKALPDDTHIISPNGPFPLPRIKPDRLDFGYAWYFYDRFSQSYHVDQKLVVGLLHQLIETQNPHHLPVTIIGFSQGGYLAPLVAYSHKSVKHVIGIGCEFKAYFFQEKPSFTLSAIHGSDDPLVPITHAREQIELLKAQGIHVSWHEVQNLKHEITSEVSDLVKKELKDIYGK